MSMLSVLIKDLVEKTTLEDGTYLVAGTTDANKITFLNLVNAIKKKLGGCAEECSEQSNNSSGGNFSTRCVSGEITER